MGPGTAWGVEKLVSAATWKSLQMRLGWGQVLKDLVCHIELRLYPLGQKEKVGGEEGRKCRSMRERLCLCICWG